MEDDEEGTGADGPAGTAKAGAGAGTGAEEGAEAGTGTGTGAADPPLDGPAIHGPLPGPNAKAIVEEDHRYLATTTKHLPVAAARAEGCLVEDVDGNVFLDFTAGVSVLNVGYAHPRVVEAVRDQAGRLMHFAGTDFYYDVQSRLAHRLSDLAPVPGESKVFLCNSGTEAIEAAMKMAKWHGAEEGRGRFLAFLGAFHGRTLGSLSLTASKVVHRRRYFPMTPGALHAPYPDPYRNPWGIDGYADPGALVDAALSYVEDQIFEHLVAPDEVAACVVEPVQGEGGYVVPPDGFLPALEDLCEDHGILLVADEVQAGMGRTGRRFAVEHSGVEPDIVCVAKALGSGLPIGAAIARGELDFGAKGAHSTTFGGNALACAAALATLDVIEEEGLVEQAAERGNHLHARLEELADDHPLIGDVRGLGLMQAIDLVADAETRTPAMQEVRDVVQAAFQEGLILLTAGRSAIRLIPPLVVTEEQIDRAVDILDGALGGVGG